MCESKSSERQWQIRRINLLNDYLAKKTADKISNPMKTITVEPIEGPVVIQESLKSANELFHSL